MATFSVMSDVPNPIIVDAAGTAGSGYVLKAFLPGTTTSTSIAIDSAGGSPQTSITANAEGKWEVTGNEILPYIDRKHKWGIFKNATDAAANTPFYMGPFDNVEKLLSSTEAQWELWDTGVTYDIPDIVKGSDDRFYRSLANSNQGNDPTSSAANWEEIEFERIFNVNVTYALGDRTIGSDGMLYFSLVASNLNNNPTTETTSTKWRAADQIRSAVGGGTVDAITATYIPAVGALKNGLELRLRSAGANTSTTPTFAPNGLTAKTIVKLGNQALVPNDIGAAGHEVIFTYNSTNDNWELLNPATNNGAELLINGGFDIWQRGTSFTDPDNTYTADRWVSDTKSTGGAGTITRETFTLGQTDVPGNPKYFYQHDQTTAVTAVFNVLNQRTESVLRGSGETVTYKFLARVTSGTKTLQVRTTQNFGTGGSPSSAVNTTEQALNLTTTFQKFSFDFAVGSISGKTLGTDGNDNLAFVIREIASFSTYTLQIAQMQAGVDIGDFESLPQSEILERCQRYYEKSYDTDTDPGATNSLGAIIDLGTRNSASNTPGARYAVAKRETPTVLIFSPVSGDSGKADNNGTERTAIGTSGGWTGFKQVVITSGSTSTVTYHWSADAEL